MDGYERTIFHVDVNSAFLSWSALKILEEDPAAVDLRTIPSGVGGDVTDYSRVVIPPRFTDGDPLNDECATNDSGIVYAENGPYLFVIYSDYPCPWTGGNRLIGLTDALYEACLEKT